MTFIWKILKHCFQRLIHLKLIYLKPFPVPACQHVWFLVIKQWALLMSAHIITLAEPKCTLKSFIKKQSCQEKVEIKSISTQSQKIVFSKILWAEIPGTTAHLCQYLKLRNSVLLPLAAEKLRSLLLRKRSCLLYISTCLFSSMISKLQWSKQDRVILSVFLLPFFNHMNFLKSNKK